MLYQILKKDMLKRKGVKYKSCFFLLHYQQSF